MQACNMVMQTHSYGCETGGTSSVEWTVLIFLIMKTYSDKAYCVCCDTILDHADANR